jgi:hypothetical protein|tara:strand:- start:119 stop:406 length:288 start_codon:yes stop_codon:yes gene_type:complete
MRVTGVSGRLCYRYQTAAVLGSWSIEPVTGSTGHRFRLSAQVEERVEPWIHERPLDAHLDFGSGKWIWSNIDPDEFTMTLSIELSDHPTITKESK